MKRDSLGDRMKKKYEDAYRISLTGRTPVIIRLDGKAFHTFTKGAAKPYDPSIIYAMQDTTKYLVDNIQGCKVGYVQSDEISLLLTDFDTFETEAWFNNNLQKMVSISASMCAVEFTFRYGLFNGGKFKRAHFDARAFNLPKEEVLNYFRWRYMDWKRNSVSMLAQANFPHKQLQKKNTDEMKAMCAEIGKPWDGLEGVYKNGTLFYQGCLLEDFDLMDNEKWSKNFNEMLGVE